MTTYDQYGPEEHAQHRYRKGFKGHPLNAVVVCTWNNRDYGPGGKGVFLTNEAVAKPLQVFDLYDDRSLIENCCIKESKQPQFGISETTTGSPDSPRHRLSDGFFGCNV